MGKLLYVKGKVIGRGKPLVCVPVMAEDKEEIIRQAAALVQKKVEMLEWRVDAFGKAKEPEAVREVVAALEPLVQDTVLVYTFRSQAQGGMKSLSREKMNEIHQIGASAGAVDLVDVEFFREENPEEKISKLQNLGACIIASHHDFDKTSETVVLEEQLERMYRSGADVVKLAVMPREAEDVIHLLAVTSRFHKKHPDTPLVTMSMGSLGIVSRISGETFGSCVTFGAGERASAPGQLPAQELEHVLAVLHTQFADSDC